MPTHNDETLLERYQREHRVYEGMNMSKAERLIESWCASITQEQHEIAGANLATEIRRLSAINAELLDALKKCHATLTDSRIGQWSYMEGSEIYTDFSEAAYNARAAIAKAQGEQPCTP